MRGAEIRPRTRCIAAARDGGVWRLTVEDRRTGATEQLRARALVNAAGPWAGSLLGTEIQGATLARIRLVQGSHIVVPKLFDHGRCYIFQAADGRIVFAIPFEADFTLIGTTDRDYEGDPAEAAASAEEIAYLCRATSEYFTRPVRPADVLWTYSGVRPLYDDGASEAQAVTRDYVLALDAVDGAAPLLSVFGGKITTFRRLAGAALDKLAPHLPGRLPAAAWLATAPLPGGDFPVDGVDDLASRLMASHPFLEDALVRRLVRTYGTRAALLLGGVRSRADLGRGFGADLSEREVVFLMQHEWAQTAADVVWRRSKLGLRMSPTEIAALDAWMASAFAAGAQARFAQLHQLPGAAKSA